MYTRVIQPHRDSPVENGKPLQGTWDRAFKEVDLLDIRRPYRWPLPRWIKNCRIKEWESFIVQDERIILDVLLANLKLYSVAQILLYDKLNEKKYLYRRLLPGNSLPLPRSLDNTFIESGPARFSFRVHNWFDADTIKLVFNMEANRRQPALTAHLELNMDGACPMAVNLGFSEQRSMYALKTMAAVSGDIMLEGTRIHLNPQQATGVFCDYKGFFPYRMKQTLCGTVGFDDEGHSYGFHIGENQTKENNRNNENALWLNGRLSPLPPVRITMPKGVDSDWVIQDLEGMVDLVFSPKEPNKSIVGFFITSVEYDAPLGLFNGTLLDSEGQKIQVRNQWGIGQKLYLRV